MPSLNLSNILHRDPSRPTLKQRAASLRARLPCPKPMAAAADAPADDAELIALESEFRDADREHEAAQIALGEARERHVEPAMPKELRVWRHDWIHSQIPRPRVVPVAGGGHRTAAYGEREVEQMRGTRCLRPSYCDQGERQPDGTRAVPDTMAQERVDAIVAAWDGWQAAIEAAENALGLPSLHDARDEAEDRRVAILERVRQTPARSLAGLGIKARIAATVIGTDDVRTEGLTRYLADDDVGLPYDLVGDVLALTAKAES